MKPFIKPAKMTRGEHHAYKTPVPRAPMSLTKTKQGWK